MEIKIEDLLREIAELKLQLSKALARIEELEKENKKLKNLERLISFQVFTIFYFATKVPPLIKIIVFNYYK